MNLGSKLGWIVLGASLSFGCGPQAADADSGEAGTAGSGNADDAESTGGSDGDESGALPPGTTGETPATTGEVGTTGADACADAFDDEPAGETVVTIRNATAEVLYVGRDGGCALEPFDMLGIDDAAIAWHSGDCAMSCEDVLGDACFFCGPCAGSPIVRVGPGETWERTWSGLSFPRIDFPAGCLDAPCESTCERAQAVEAGAYTLRAEARTECGAADPAGCECPDGAQTCTLTIGDGEIPAATVEVTAELVHPAAAVEIVFE